MMPNAGSPFLNRPLRGEEEVNALRDMDIWCNEFARLLDALRADPRIAGLIDVRRPRVMGQPACIDPALTLLEDLNRAHQRAMEYSRRVAIYHATQAALTPINAALDLLEKRT